MQDGERHARPNGRAWIIAATVIPSIAKLIAILRNHDDGRLPSLARAALFEMAELIERLVTPVEALDAKIVAVVKIDKTARRLMTTVRAAIQDPGACRTGRDLTAWILDQSNAASDPHAANGSAVANPRVHATKRRVVNEALAEERAALRLLL